MESEHIEARFRPVWLSAIMVSCKSRHDLWLRNHHS